MDYSRYISNVEAWKECCRPDKKINFYFLPITKWFDLDKERFSDWYVFRSKSGSFGLTNAWLEDLHFQYVDQNGQEKSFVINTEWHPAHIRSDNTMQGRILMSLKPGRYVVTARGTLESQRLKLKKKTVTKEKQITIVVPNEGDVIACFILGEAYKYDIEYYEKKGKEEVVDRKIRQRITECFFSQITASQASGFYEWWRDASSLAKVVVPEGEVGGLAVSSDNDIVADSNDRAMQNNADKPKANAQKTAEQLKQERIASLKKSLSNYSTDDLLSGRVAQWEAMYMAETGKYFVKESDYKWTVPDLSEIQPPKAKIVWKNSGYFDVIEPKKPKVKKDKHKIHFTPEELGHVTKEEPKPRVQRKPRSTGSADVVDKEKTKISKKQINDQKAEKGWKEEGWDCRVDGKYVKVVGCDNPTEKIVVPEGVTVFGWGFFGYSARMCRLVKEIVLPSTVTDMDERAFKNCVSLEKIDLSKTEIKQIPNEAFAGCANLKELYLNDKTNYVALSAFDGCDQLPFAFAGEKLFDFRRCKYSLTNRQQVYSRTFEKSSPQGRALLGIKENKQVESSGVKSTQVMQQVKPVEYEEISASPQPYVPKPVDLKVCIPSSIKEKFSIGLKSYSRKDITTLTLPKKVKELKPAWFSHCLKLEEVDLSQTSITTISEGCFRYCINLKKVVLPATVTKIEKEAFERCVRLESISLTNITKIGEKAFYECESLTDINLAKATEVENHAFCGCCRLKTASLPVLINLNPNTFALCGSLKDVCLPLAQNLDAGAFSACVSLERVNLPSLKSLKCSTFCSCWKGLKLFVGKTNRPESIVGKYDIRGNETIQVQ